MKPDGTFAALIREMEDLREDNHKLKAENATLRRKLKTSQKHKDPVERFKRSCEREERREKKRRFTG